MDEVRTVTPQFTATLLQPARKGSIQRRCSLLFEIQTDMAVDVERDGNTAVSQHDLHYLGGYPLLQEPGGKGVAGIVEPDWWEISPLQGLAEVAVHGSRIDGFSLRPAKH